MTDTDDTNPPPASTPTTSTDNVLPFDPAAKRPEKAPAAKHTDPHLVGQLELLEQASARMMTLFQAFQEKQQQHVSGLFFDVPAAELAELLAGAASRCDLEIQKLTDDASIDDGSKEIITRTLSTRVLQLSFLAKHVVEGKTYRLTAHEIGQYFEPALTRFPGCIGSVGCIPAPAPPRGVQS